MIKRISKASMALASLIALVVLGIAALALFRPKPELPEPHAEPRTPVTTSRAQARTLDDIATFPARIEALSDVWVAAEQGGRVTEIGAREGETVEKGAVLLRVDDRLRATALRRAERMARDARRDFERLTELRRDGAVSASDYEAMESRAALAEVALEEARVVLDQCVVRAPIRARIEERRVDSGEFVQPGQPLFRLVDAARVKAVFDLPERDTLSASPGDTHNFRLDALPDRYFSGMIGFAAGTGARASGAFRVELDADNAEGLMRPGMIARVAYRRGAIAGAIVLPQQAIVPALGETVVFVVEDGRAIRRIVRIGAFIGEHAVIRAGVEAGDEVILEGNRSVLDGTPVRVVSSDEASIRKEKIKNDKASG